MKKNQKKHIRMLARILVKHILVIKKSNLFKELKNLNTIEKRIESNVLLKNQYTQYKCFKKLILFVYNETELSDSPGSYRLGCAIMSDNGINRVGLNYRIIMVEPKKVLKRVMRHELGHVYESVYNNDYSEEAANKYE